MSTLTNAAGVVRVFLEDRVVGCLVMMTMRVSYKGCILGRMLTSRPGTDDGRELLSQSRRWKESRNGGPARKRLVGLK